MASFDLIVCRETDRNSYGHFSKKQRLKDEDELRILFRTKIPRESHQADSERVSRYQQQPGD